MASIITSLAQTSETSRDISERRRRQEIAVKSFSFTRSFSYKVQTLAKSQNLTLLVS